MTITILYSCRQCRLSEVPIAVEDRGVYQDVEPWVVGVSLQVERDHASRSPLCDASDYDCVIPVGPGDDARIGDPTKH